MAAFVVLWWGCTQRESDVGENAITNQPGDDFEVIELAADSVRAVEFHPRLSNGRGQSLQIGDTSFSAFSVVRFTPASVLPDSYRVDSMVYVLRKNRVWPPSTSTVLQVRVKEVREAWYEDSLFAGSLSGRDSFPEIGSFSMGTAPLDTLYRFNIPQSTWEPWVAGDTTKWGLLLEPISSGVLVELYSGEAATGFQSLLEIYGVEFRDSSGVITDTVLFRTASASSDGYLAVSHADDRSPERLIVSQGFPQRAAMYFDTRLISDVYSRQVNRAQMVLYAVSGDAANVLYTGQNLSFKDGSLQDTMWFATPDSAKLDFIAIEPSFFDSTNSFVVFNVTGIVAEWITRPDRNAGIQVQSALETGYLGRQVFYGPAAEDRSKRPRLLIWYTER